MCFVPAGRVWDLFEIDYNLHLRGYEKSQVMKRAYRRRKEGSENKGTWKTMSLNHRRNQSEIGKSWSITTDGASAMETEEFVECSSRTNLESEVRSRGSLCFSFQHEKVGWVFNSACVTIVLNFVVYFVFLRSCFLTATSSSLTLLFMEKDKEMTSMNLWW